MAKKFASQETSRTFSEISLLVSLLKTAKATALGDKILAAYIPFLSLVGIKTTMSAVF